MLIQTKLVGILSTYFSNNSAIVYTINIYYFIRFDKFYDMSDWKYVTMFSRLMDASARNFFQMMIEGGNIRELGF